MNADATPMNSDQPRTVFVPRQKTCNATKPILLDLLAFIGVASAFIGVSLF
jgi:hypothetical protein